MSSTAAVHVPTHTITGIEHCLALDGIPLARLLTDAKVPPSTWAGWRGGRNRPRPDRWASVTVAFDALVAKAKSAQPEGVPTAPAAEPEAAGADVVSLAESLAPTGAPPSFAPITTAPVAEAPATAPPSPGATALVEADTAVIAAADRVAALGRREMETLYRFARASDRRSVGPDRKSETGEAAAHRLHIRAHRRLKRAVRATVALQAGTPAGVAAKARVVLSVENATDADPWWVALRDATLHDAARLDGSCETAAPANIDPFTGYHQEVVDLQARMLLLPEDEADHLWARWKDIDDLVLTSQPTTIAGAVGALDYARRELHQFRVENKEDPNPTEILVLHLIDGALGVIRPQNGTPVVAAADLDALTAEWVLRTAQYWRDDKASDDIPRGPGADAELKRMRANAAHQSDVLWRIADLRSTSPRVLALKAAAVLADCCNAAELDADIARRDGSSRGEAEIAVALSLVRDVIALNGDPVRRLVAAVAAAAEAPIAGDAASGTVRAAA